MRIIYYLVNKLISDNRLIVTYRLLKLLKINASYDLLKSRILEHQNYGSLLSIYETIESIGLEVDAYKNDSKNLKDYHTPFIAQIRKDETDLFVVAKTIDSGKMIFYDEHNKKRKLLITEFQEIWTGISLSIKEPVVKLSAKKNNYNAVLLCVLFIGVLLILFPGAYFFKTGSLVFFIGYFLLKIGGLSIGLMLLWYDIDRFNPIINKVCSSSISKKINCNAVLSSKGSSLFNWTLNLSELIVSYFLGTLLFLSIAFAGRYTINYLEILSLVSLLAVMYSFIYQKFIIKQWCLLCIFVQIILVLEVLWGTFFDMIALPSLDYRDILILVFMLTLPLVLWKPLKPLLKKTKENAFVKRQFNQLKFKQAVFAGLLEDSQEMQYSTEGLGIEIGNKNAAYKVVKVCNPYCSPCAKAHVVLEELIENEIIHLKIIFNSRPDYHNANYLPTFHFMTQYEKDASQMREVLDFWYGLDKKNNEVLEKKFPIMRDTRPNQSPKIEAMHEWCVKEKITHTPTLYINGRILPNEYAIKDLLNLLY